MSSPTGCACLAFRRQGILHPHFMALRMKRILLEISAMTMLMTEVAFAEAETFVIDQGLRAGS